jgi:biopolymer transport protein TolR
MGMSRRVKGQRSDINVTPYIDILLVLLIIFMVIQPTIQYNLEARVPDKPDEDMPKDVVVQTEAIVISVNPDGTVSINQEPVLMAQLGSRLFEIYSARANKNMFVQADQSLPFGDVIRVIDIAKGAGVGDVGLMTATAQ